MNRSDSNVEIFTKKPLVSVIVVTYNQEEYVSKTLESILNQKCSFEYEIIIGNDCSTDRTKSICEQYYSSFPDKIVLINRNQNLGVNKNYTDCIRTCQGKYIAQCAGDDFWADDSKLEKQVKLMESNPEYFITYAQCNLLSENSYTEKESLQPAEITLADVRLYNIAGLAACTILYQNALSKNDLEVIENAVFEDWALMIVMLSKGKGYFSGDVLGVYRITKNGLWQGISGEEKLIRVLDFYDNLSRSLPGVLGNIKELKLRHLQHTIREAVKHNRKTFDYFHFKEKIKNINKRAIDFLFSCTKLMLRLRK